MIARRFLAAFYVNAGADIALKVNASGVDLKFQWRLNGKTIEGGTGGVLSISNISTTAGGTYSVVVSNPNGATSVDIATVTVVCDARLSSLFIRSHVGSGEKALVVGFFVGGAGSKQVLLRGIGPTLQEFGVKDVLSRPELALHGRGSKLLASNSGWEHSAALGAAFIQVGAFPLPADSTDAALLQKLGTGGYTVHVSGASGTSGTALTEIYDADSGLSVSSLVNGSGRGHLADASAELVMGFTITGSTSETLLIRGIGPSLGRFGLGGALAATQVTLHDAQGKAVASNRGWGGSASLASIFNQVGAFPLPPSSLDSALLVTLRPGAYTARLSGAGTTGIGLIEAYDVPCGTHPWGDVSQEVGSGAGKSSLPRPG